MELNWTCYNDVLLFIEKELVFDTENVRPNEFKIKGISPNTIFNGLSSYKQEDIYYSLMRFDSDGFIKVRHAGVDEIFEIQDITTRGHLYLKQIKQEKMSYIKQDQ